MKILTDPFDIRAWRRRLHLTQAEAATALGLSQDAYRRVEYACMDRPGCPVRRTYRLLAEKIEAERRAS